MRHCTPDAAEAPTSGRRHLRLPALAAVTLFAGLGVQLSPVSVTSAHAHTSAGTGGSAGTRGSTTTVTGNWHRWDPLANGGQYNGGAGGYDTSSIPSVTVDQTASLVDQVVHVSWQHFTPTSNDPTYYGAPAPGTLVLPLGNATLYPVEILECAGTTPSVAPGQATSECYSADIGGTDGGHGANNGLDAVTQADGTGSADFHVENAVTNDLLGCDPTHACSIVVIPNNGGVQDNLSGSNGKVNCASHKSDFLLPPDYSQFNSYAGRDYLRAACSWADRIVVPIHFAALPSNCPASSPQFSAVGSPMLRRTLSQLQAGWCHGAHRVSFSYNSTSDEYQARTLFAAGGGALTASTDMALVTQPIDAASAGSRKFTYAPIADDAISIAYYVDNVRTGLPITDLRLDARLVAKLLTQSYAPFIYNCYGTDPKVAGPACAPAVHGNPVSIFDDPEFQRLNFRGSHPDRSFFPGASQFPTVVAGNSDMTYELTRWIESDPAARGFLAGKPDKWGMHVNTNYLVKKGAPAYPISQFQPLDPGWTAGPKDNPFIEGFQGSWNPVSGLDNVATLQVGYQSTAQDTNGGLCEGNAALNADCLANHSLPISFPKVPSIPVGQRDLFAVVDNSTAAAYKFPTAALINSAGAAVLPTQGAMHAALAEMATNKDGITQYVDHAHEASSGYPLTVADYAMVPTCGLTRAKVGAIGTMLARVVGSQHFGVSPGTVPPGMQLLTKAQVARTRKAASEVSSGSCTTPPPDKHMHRTTVAHPHRPTTNQMHNSGSSGAQRNTPSSGVDATSTAPDPSTSASAPASPSPSPSPSTPALDHGYKPVGQSGSLTSVLPIMLLLGALFLLGAPLTWALTGTAAGRALVARLRPRR